MSTQQPDLVLPLSPRGIQARLATAPAVGTGMDTDLVRGRALPTDVFRFDLAPAFVSPPGFGEVVAQSLFGV